jgi:hypothetical protein
MAFMFYIKNINGVTNVSEISKAEYFIACLCDEIKNSDNPDAHFLRIGGITPEYLNRARFLNMDRGWGCKKATRHALQMAIYDFFQIFDRKLYDSFFDTRGLFTKIIWAKFRRIYSNWNVHHRYRLESDSRLINERYRDDCQQQDKEKVQILRTGNGNMDSGCTAFVNRMKIQKSEKLNKVNDVSIALEEKFSKWLDTDEAKSYSTSIVDGACKQFHRGNTYMASNSVTTINLKVNNISGIIDAIRQLSNHHGSDRLTLTVTLAWDEKIPFSNPTSYVIPYYGVPLNITAVGRINQNDTNQVIGFHEIANDVYIVTEKNRSVYKSFPKCFSKLKYPKVKGLMSVCHKVNNSLSRLQVTRTHEGVKYLMNIDIFYKGTPTVDATKIFDNHVIRNLKYQTSQSIVIKNLEKLHGQRNVIKSPNTQTPFIDVPPTPMNSPAKTDPIDQIMKLCDMFEKGLLSTEQFETIKSMVLV